MRDLEYHTSVLHDETNYIGLEWNLSIKMNLYFVIYNTGPLHGKFKPRDLITCLNPKYRVVVQCQNIVYVLLRDSVCVKYGSGKTTK